MHAWYIAEAVGCCCVRKKCVRALLLLLMRLRSRSGFLSAPLSPLRFHRSGLGHHTSDHGKE